MRFLADENVMGEIVAELRALGHEVEAVSETMRSMDDRSILAAAAQADRILLTEDQDFGELVVHRGLPIGGVVLFELHRMSPQAMARRSVDAVVASIDTLHGRFTVIEPARIRSRPLA